MVPINDRLEFIARTCIPFLWQECEGCKVKSWEKQRSEDMSSPGTFLSQDIGVGHKGMFTRHGCHRKEYQTSKRSPYLDPCGTLYRHIITFPPPNFCVPSTSLSFNSSPTSFKIHFLPSDPRWLILVSSDHITLSQSSKVHSLWLSAKSSLSFWWCFLRKAFSSSLQPWHQLISSDDE